MKFHDKRQSDAARKSGPSKTGLDAEAPPTTNHQPRKLAVAGPISVLYAYAPQLHWGGQWALFFFYTPYTTRTTVRLVQSPKRQVPCRGAGVRRSGSMFYGCSGFFVVCSLLLEARTGHGMAWPLLYGLSPRTPWVLISDLLLGCYIPYAAAGQRPATSRRSVVSGQMGTPGAVGGGRCALRAARCGGDERLVWSTPSPPLNAQ
jgi:hypothetical protein